MYFMHRFFFTLIRKNNFVLTSSYGSILVQRSKSQTMKYLNVAEKNDAAKNIALHLSRGTSKRREGLSQYNKIYEFEAQVMGQKCQMVMTSVSGHLLALEFASSYKSWQSCNPLTLFDAPVIKYCPENYEKIKKTLEKEVRSCQGLIIWTDCDREGENIGFEIVEVCSSVKSNLRIYRAKFSEITSVSVNRALQNLEQPNRNISNAVDVRQELDLRIGAAFTRFQTLRLQKVFPSKLADSLISYGSCQFPTLGFVVERYRDVNNFVSETFWKIKVNHTMNNLSVDFAWDRIRLFDQESCEILHDVCKENPLAKVVNVRTKPKSKWRPLPLDTVELEKLASRKLKINAKETMRLAEKLYTQGFISYPRTETNEFPKEMNLRQLVEHHTGDPNWGGFAQRILEEGGPTPRQGSKSDKAHPPIHPTKYTNNLSGNEQRLYEFIVRSFLACCAKDAQGQETTVTIHLADETFSASGLMIIARNYLEVYPYDKWSSKEIHVYENGQTFNPTSIDLVEGNTSPPNLLTEADLIALMEKHGIGTDATHAEHIETIKSRSYVALADAVHFVPGVLGMGLVEGYDAMGLHMARPALRAQLEADLKAISEGTKQPDLVLAEQIARYKEAYIMVTAEADKIDNALAERFNERPNEYVPTTETLPVNMPTVFKCPKCGSGMVLKQKKNNAEELFLSCESYPSCKNAVWLPKVVKSLEVQDRTCPTCGPNYNIVKFEWRNNSISHLYPPPYDGCIGGCDPAFLDILQINPSSVKTVNSNQNIPNNSRPIVENRINTANTNDVRPQRQTTIGSMPTRNRHAEQIAPTGNNNRVQNTAQTRLPTPRAVGDEDNNVLCGCNKPAIQLTVRKQNANFGKKFYKCAAMRESGGCDFFLWAPESENTVQSSSETPADSGRGSASSGGSSARGWGVAPTYSRTDYQPIDDNVMCNCGVPARRVTVQKEGPNKGRPFYGCPKEFSSRCNFFQWADSDTTVEWNNNSGSSSRGRGRGRGGGNTSGRGGGNASGRGGGNASGRGGGSAGGGGGGRKCGLCRQSGHTRSRCPNNQ
ncbi:PREDICTED: DNA topoisomerase 3-alpha [Papilio polytes]|uniref:DNA topoisomerase 3-alpha n=1 Tax=Papilio polytes TaxID=76194 RepID=UPI000675CCF1|nr:PREDICTED: DNA topoisomerase 3-alpha [Papilio polytes]